MSIEFQVAWNSSQHKEDCFSSRQPHLDARNLRQCDNNNDNNNLIISRSPVDVMLRSLFYPNNRQAAEGRASLLAFTWHFISQPGVNLLQSTHFAQINTSGSLMFIIIVVVVLLLLLLVDAIISHTTWAPKSHLWP